MASFKLKFRPSTTNKEGTLYFQVIHRRSTRTVYTDYHIRPDEWNEKTSSVRITGTPERQAELRMVVSKVRWDCRQITSLITEKELAMVEYTADDIVSAFKVLPPCQTWFSFIHGMIAKKLRVGRLGTAKTYRDALASFSRFREGGGRDHRRLGCGDHEPVRGMAERTGREAQLLVVLPSHFTHPLP